MQKFLVVDAAFSGLRAMRDRPMTILFWYGFNVLAFAVSLGASAVLMGPALAQMRAATGGDPQIALAASMKVLAGTLYLVPLVLLTAAMSAAAANRAILRPDQSAFGYFRLGADELRVLATVLAVGLIVLLIYVLAVIILAVLAIVVMAATGSFSAAAPSPAGAVLTVVVVLVGLIPVGAAILYFAARFSLATPLTLDSGSIKIFESWRLTKGSAGKIMLTYLLATAVYIGIYAATYLLIAIVYTATGGSILQAAQPDLSSLAQLFKPAMLARIAISSVTGVASFALLYSPGAYIYQRLVGKGVADVF